MIVFRQNWVSQRAPENTSIVEKRPSTHGGGNNPPSPERDAKYIKLFTAGVENTVIAKQLGITVGTVSKMQHRLGLPPKCVIKHNLKMARRLAAAE